MWQNVNNLLNLGEAGNRQYIQQKVYENFGLFLQLFKYV